MQRKRTIMGKRSRMPKAIFVNPAGQRDNLGDSVLRRPYLDALRSAGTLHVLIGSDLDFASGLGLRDSDVAYVSRLKWLISAASAILVERAAFAVNAGEVVGTRPERRRASWQSALSGLAAVRRAPVIMAGLSLRPGTEVAETRLPSLARRAAVVVWRDQWSRDAVGVGVVAPDWAFAEGSESPNEETRTILAVSMRGDRPAPTAAWIQDLVAFAGDENCEVVVVVQVRRDAQRATELSESLNARVIEWPDDANHAAQEAALRAVYSQARFVVSDRIHALILGVTEGAIPVGLPTDGSQKITRTFSPVTELPVGPIDGMSTGDRLRILASSSDQVRADLAGARATLGSVAASIREAVARVWDRQRARSSREH
jgi:polysaccharide pyruvyl transferase WcaK-like protein